MSRLTSLLKRHREYLGRVKEEGELILQELAKLINLSLFNQKIGEDDIYKFTHNDMNFFKQQIGYFDKPCDRMAAKLNQIEKQVIDLQMTYI